MFDFTSVNNLTKFIFSSDLSLLSTRENLTKPKIFFYLTTYYPNDIFYRWIRVTFWSKKLTKQTKKPHSGSEKQPLRSDYDCFLNVSVSEKKTSVCGNCSSNEIHVDEDGSPAAVGGRGSSSRGRCGGARRRRFRGRVSVRLRVQRSATSNASARDAGRGPERPRGGGLHGVVRATGNAHAASGLRSAGHHASRRVAVVVEPVRQHGGRAGSGKPRPARDGRRRPRVRRPGRVRDHLLGAGRRDRCGQLDATGVRKVRSGENDVDRPTAARWRQSGVGSGADRDRLSA